MGGKLRAVSIKDTKLWMDLIILSIFWMLSIYIPQEITIFNLVSLSIFLKIVSLLGTLEVIGFFTMLYLGERGSILIQGFLGGFVSSTATFLHFTHMEEFKENHPRSVSRALLLATMAMLIESIFIILSLNVDDAFLLCRPFFIQLLVLLILVIALKSKNFSVKKSSHHMALELKELIIWKNVLKFSFFMVGLIFLMRILNTTLDIPPVLSTFLLSLFESHAVLAASMSEYGQGQNSQLAFHIVLAILVGNVMSKTFFILRAKNKAIRKPVLFSLYFSLLLGILSILLF